MQRPGILSGVLLCWLAGLHQAAAPARAQPVPGYPDVMAELVQVPGARSDDTPPALNRVTFLRLRPVASDPELEVDAVVIAQPGFSSTPGAWLQVSAQLVSKARQQACPIAGSTERRCVIEVWVIDRRGSHVEDTAGLLAAWRQGDPAPAVRYYWGADAFTEEGLIRRPEGGDYDAMLAGPGAAFRPLSQDDLRFMWDWGFETAAGDVDALIGLLPRRARGTNVFLAGHSQGGGFVAAWAGRRGLGANRGHQNVAGLIFLDGGPALGEGAPGDEQVGLHVGTVRSMELGNDAVYGAELAGITLGAGLAVRSAIQGLYYMLRPEDEAVLAPSVAPHPAAECFVFGRYLPADRCAGVGLRLTNRAHAGMAFDDDPIPGAFLQTPVITALGIRSGRLDFAPAGGAWVCAAEGPQGDRRPCPPNASMLDPQRVYDWLDGGGGGPAGNDGPFNGWSFGPDGWSDRLLQPGPNPSKAVAYMLQTGFAPTRTNVEPIAVRLTDAGRVTLDARVLNGMTWYQSRRYDLDLRFLGQYVRIDFERAGVRHDVDKSAIAVPVYVAARQDRENPFPAVTDYTAIGPGGLTQTRQALARGPFDATLSTRFYGHSDFLSADDSSAGSVKPGEPGANVVSATLVDWLLARSSGTVRTPDPDRLGVVDWRRRD
ncbi:MAG TPA: hypothetical protein VMV46_06350 [Thermoanaerobaculia bacterium]|nr:hypothetical protein [Thermoanaerobaculia bacterium]